MINMIRQSKFLALSVCCGVVFASLPATAEDIDIFTGSSGGAAAAPKIMILMDNSNNWVSDNPQGKTKFAALSAVLDTITTPMNVGLATFSYNTPSGAYIRFAPRDMSILANRTAFKNLMAQISADANVTRETGNIKDESAAFYEIYKYFSGLAPRAGTLAQNRYADASGNTGDYAGSTAFGQGLATGFAFKVDGTYDSVATTCGKNYIIYIVSNNASGGSLGLQVYETTDSGAKILPFPGSPDTYADEWARFLFANPNPQIVTFVLDSYYPDGNQDLGYSLSLQGTAKSGGGTYKHVRGTTDLNGKTDILNELLRIFAEIKAVNTTFASASLPVNATNRAQNQNQVFIGMFRPDPDAKPRYTGMSLFIAPKQAGFRVGRKLEKLGYKSIDSAELIFEDYRIPADHLIGEVEGQGFYQATGGLELGRINVASRGVGIAEGALKLASEYAQIRKTFGKPICEHQAIQLKIGEMATRARAARLLTLDAARAFDNGERCDMEAGMAKYFASEAALENSIEGMRIHGANGYSREYDIERLYRDAPLTCIGEGTNEMQRLIIARQWLKRSSGA